MTPSPDLLAVLREAREALRSCAWSTELRTDDALMAMATADAKIGEATMMLTVSALRAPEAQGWRPITEANAQRALDAYTDAISSHPLATEEGTRDATRIRRIRLDAMIDALQTLAPPPETTT